jgi:hypothetical protein
VDDPEESDAESISDTDSIERYSSSVKHLPHRLEEVSEDGIPGFDPVRDNQIEPEIFRSLS